MRVLALFVVFTIGLISGMVIDLPEIPGSPLIDQKIEIRRGSE